MTDFKAFLLKLTQNLTVLQEREAKYGGNPPLELVNQISDHQEAVALTEQALAGQLTEAAWREALQPLLVAIQARPGEAASGLSLGDIGGSIEPSTLAGRDINQFSLNVVNLMGRSGAQAEPALQALAELVLAQIAAYDPKTAQRYRANPAGYAVPLQDSLAELLQADRGLAARLDSLLARYEAAPPTRPTYQARLEGPGAIAQGPGAQAVGERGVIVGGNVGGNVVTGSHNIISTETVGRDKITGVTGAELAQMFQAIYRQIETRPADPNVDKAEITETVQKIEQEIDKGDEANPSKIERWLKSLKAMAPDIGDVTIACLTNPAAGVAMVIKKIAEKAQAEAGQGS